MARGYHIEQYNQEGGSSVDGQLSWGRVFKTTEYPVKALGKEAD